MATFAELADYELTDNQGPDSISFANLLLKPMSAGSRKNLIMQSVASFVVRSNDWKLCLCPGSGGLGKYGNQPTPTIAWQQALEQFGKSPTHNDLTTAPFVQLFNLADDVSEQRNLASDHPEKVSQLVQLLQQQIRDGRSNPGPKLKNGRERVSLHRRLPPFVRQQLKPSS